MPTYLEIAKGKWPDFKGRITTFCPGDIVDGAPSIIDGECVTINTCELCWNQPAPEVISEMERK